MRAKPVKRSVFWAAMALMVAWGCTSKQYAQGVEEPCAAGGKLHIAVTPATRPHQVWMERHQALLRRVEQGKVDLVFIGNSLTQRWESAGQDAWNRYYSHRNAVNLGVDGDGTQHVLWRLDHGEIDGISPKLAVLLIGSNHVNGYSVAEIVDGIKAICCRIRTKLPKTKILLLGILPRGDASAAAAYRLNKASELASAVADNRMIFYLNVSEQFLQEDGHVSKELMTVDGVHLSPNGYEVLAEALEPMVSKLMAGK